MAARRGSPPHRTAGFTFIELVVAVALSVILLQAIYSIFSAATDLASAAEEKSRLFLEASGMFDSLVDDLYRVPMSGTTHISASGSSLRFKAHGRASGEAFVTISYRFERVNDYYGKLVRDVYKYDPQNNNFTTTPVDDDGDGLNDTNMTVGRIVQSFDTAVRTGGSPARPLAVQFQIVLLSHPIRNAEEQFQGKMNRSPMNLRETFSFTVPVMTR